MPSIHDGPRSRRFAPVPFRGNATLAGLAKKSVSDLMKKHVGDAPSGACTCWGVPFEVARVACVVDKPVEVALPAVTAPWLVFMHTADWALDTPNKDGLFSPSHGPGRLGLDAGTYVLRYADDREVRLPLKLRHQLAMFQKLWGENCFEAVGHRKPSTLRTLTDQVHVPGVGWGQSQTRVHIPDLLPWMNWLWAWSNPDPEVPLVGLRIEPGEIPIVLSAIAQGDVQEHPLRWRPRRKAMLTLPKDVAYDRALDEHGLSKHLQLDLGQVIEIEPKAIYPNDTWAKTHNNTVPEFSAREMLVEYTSHPEAEFWLPEVDGTTIKAGASSASPHKTKAGASSATPHKNVAVARLEEMSKAGPLVVVTHATQKVRVRVLDGASGMPVPVKLHIHGEAGEYHAPLDRHRRPNFFWNEDYSAEFVHNNQHTCTYIPGETTVYLPKGTVYVEVSKGFEIRPIRKTFKVTSRTEEITIALEKVLPWRERGWITADTHVHFLSPQTAHLEGAAEGVNVVNLLTSQWGEFMSNAGDFDGKSTIGSREAGGDGEHLVRVGTENRQHVLGHISLLGYNGDIIVPMCAGGPDESALGDPVDVLISEWAQQCRAQDGIVIMPHMPEPRAESAATLIEGLADAVEMCSWGELYAGLNPYSLSDWYRYLNCGYFYPIVGGTDKMSAAMPVGAIRTYARIPKDRPFDYEGWKEAIRGGDTFATYGPLLEFAVDGKTPGTPIAMKPRGGTVDVTYEVASVTMPMTHVDLVVNGEIRERRAVKKDKDAGHWTVKVERSSWMAVLVRGHYPKHPEIIAAHSSPVMVHVDGSAFFAAADAVTMLEQIEGALAYLETVGTRAETARYKQMRMTLMASHRKLHQRLHEADHDHGHTVPHDHHRA